MKLDELNTIDNKFRYCDKQQHLKLGSGKNVLGQFFLTDIISARGFSELVAGIDKRFFASCS